MATPWTAANIPDQRGRVAIVTGANSGLGWETARLLAIQNAHVVLACRNTAKGKQAADKIRATVPNADVEVRELDLADLSSIKSFAAGITADKSRVDLLINNAGLMAVDQGKTHDSFEMQFGVNHLGHFALTGQLLPMLTSTVGSRIVTVSSMGHRAGRIVLDDLMFERRGYHRWLAYFQSKLANILFTVELNRRLSLAGTDTIALAAHPGGSRTDLGFEGQGITNRLVASFSTYFTQSAAMGALPTVRAATDPYARGGQYYGPRFMVRGFPVLETPSRAARDMSMARQLWQASEHLVGRDILAM